MYNGNTRGQIIISDYKANINETIIPMETVGFVSIIEQVVRKTSPLKLSKPLTHIATMSNLSFSVTPTGFKGNGVDMETAKDILTYYVNNN